MNHASLLDQIGGVSAAQGISRNFLYAVRMNQELGSYFRELSEVRLQEIELRLIDLFLEELGGSTSYKGAPLESLMRNLGLTHREWTLAMGCLLEAVQAQGLSIASQNLVMKQIAVLEPKTLINQKEKQKKGVAIG